HASNGSYLEHTDTTKIRREAAEIVDIGGEDRVTVALPPHPPHGRSADRAVRARRRRAGVPVARSAGGPRKVSCERGDLLEGHEQTDVVRLDRAGEELARPGRVGVAHDLREDLRARLENAVGGAAGGLAEFHLAGLLRNDDGPLRLLVASEREVEGDGLVDS